MPNKSLSWCHPEDAPYLVLLRSPGPLSAPTEPDGNTPALRGSDEDADLQTAPSARREAGRIVAGVLMEDAPTPWPRAPVCHQLGTRAGTYGGSADPAPWVLWALSAREGFLGRSGTAPTQVRADSLQSLVSPACSGRSAHVITPRPPQAGREGVCPQIAPPPGASLGLAPNLPGVPGVVSDFSLYAARCNPARTRTCIPAHIYLSRSHLVPLLRSESKFAIPRTLRVKWVEDSRGSLSDR